MELQDLFTQQIQVKDNLLAWDNSSEYAKNHIQTAGAFSEKWDKWDKVDEEYEEFQFEWYRNCYGFDNKEAFVDFLKDKKVILDAGCGLGFKAAWFARMAPHATVIAMDISEVIGAAKEKYKDLNNLFFLQGDIANSGLKPGSIDYVSCDQVLMHTEVPEKTFAHLTSLVSDNGQFSCYVYAQKALPRELVDHHFRSAVHDFSKEDIWTLSEQLSELGKNLSELNVKVKSPEIPLLGIKEGEYDIQRFIYWNFLKCFWNPNFEKVENDGINFDWYSPSNAKRYTEEEYKQMIADNSLNIEHFHVEEACYTGRFSKK